MGNKPKKSGNKPNKSLAYKRKHNTNAKVNTKFDDDKLNDAKANIKFDDDKLNRRKDTKFDDDMLNDAKANTKFDDDKLNHRKAGNKQYSSKGSNGAVPNSSVSRTGTAQRSSDTKV